MYTTPIKLTHKVAYEVFYNAALQTVFFFKAALGTLAVELPCNREQTAQIPLNKGKVGTLRRHRASLHEKGVFSPARLLG